MDKLNLKSFAVGNIFLASVSKILLSLIILVIFIFVTGKPAYADCCCDNGGYRIGTYCYGITCSSPHFTCICACPPGDDGSTIIPPATVGGKVIAEGETGGTSNLAGPNGNSPEPGIPLKAYCEAPTFFSCSSAAADGNCEIYATCVGDYIAPVCSWGTTTYGIPGTSSLSISMDGTSSPNWISKVSINQNNSYCRGSVCVDHACIEGHYGPNFNFPNAIPNNTQHTFTVTPPAGYVCKSMVLSGATSVTVNNSCSLTATLNSGSHDLTITIIRSPQGTILGRVVNQANNDSLKSSAVCTTGTVVTGLAVDFGGGITASVDQCNPGPYYTKSLNSGINYNVSVVIPAGWEAVRWVCGSVVGGVSGGTSCPNSEGTGTVSASGDGGVVYDVPLKKDEEAHILFYIQPIAPKCTISGSTSIVVGETGTFTTSETVGGIIPNVQMKRVLSTCLATNACISSATLLASSDCDMVGCPSSVSYSWITTEADMTPSDGSQPWYFYCQGYNGAINLTSRQCRPFNPYAYPWDLDCVSGLLATHKNVCDPNSGSDCIEVNVTEPPPWYQVWGGDVHARGDITSYLPVAMATDDPTHNYFNLNAGTLLTGFPGLISFDSTYLYDFASGAGDPGTAKSSTKKWLAKSNFLFSSSSTEDSVYDYYLKKLGNPPAGTFDCSGSHNFKNLSDVQIIRPPASAEGCSIDANWNVTEGSKVIVLVDTALNILDQNTRITVDGESFLAFIANNGINIDKKLGVKQEGYTETPYVQGVYLTDGQINTGFDSTDMSGRRFIGAGMFYAGGGFVLARDLKDSPSEGTARNWNTPAELFIYRPDLATNSPSVMWSSETDWQEVAP